MDNDSQANHSIVPSHNDEVETATIRRGLGQIRSQHDSEYEHNHIDHDCDCTQDSRAVEEDSSEPIERDVLERALDELSKESIWRVKGFVRLKSGGQSQVYILNWAFGRYELTPCVESGLEEWEVIRLTVMGERGEVRRAIGRLSLLICAQVS
jgi:G3E family GTPase